MPGVTPIFGWPFQSLTDSPNGATLGEDLALAIEATLAALLRDPLIEINELTTDSANFTTTETQIQTVTASLVEGAIYKIAWQPHFASSVNNDEMRGFIREDNISGTVIQSGYGLASSTGGNLGRTVVMYGKYEAVATGNKTFSFSASRVAGTGNCRVEGAADRPSIATVELWRP